MIDNSEIPFDFEYPDTRVRTALPGQGAVELPGKYVITRGLPDGSSGMACTNCDTEIRAFTLQVEEPGIELPFCSADCVDAWV